MMRAETMLVVMESEYFMRDDYMAAAGFVVIDTYGIAGHLMKYR